MYEHRTHHLLDRRAFAKRVARHLLMTLILMCVGVGIGMIGYHYLGELSWLDSLLNASMILSGMGPVDRVTKPSAKVFASCYALFSGLAFIASASLLVAPFAHRVLHRLHLDR